MTIQSGLSYGTLVRCSMSTHEGGTAASPCQ
jgi:hypothetical protein